MPSGVCNVIPRGGRALSQVSSTLATRYASHPIALANPIATTTPPLLEMFLAQPAETAPDAGVAVTGKSPLRSCGNCNVGHDGSAPWLALVPAIALLVRRRRA